jgi:Raf kinase inhibitor-like YbhB/YbcL family protein
MTNRITLLDQLCSFRPAFIGDGKREALRKVRIVTARFQTLHGSRHDRLLDCLAKPCPMLDLLGQRTLLRLGRSTRMCSKRTAQTNGNAGHEANVAVCYKVPKPKRWLQVRDRPKLRRVKRYAIIILLAACGGDDSSSAQSDASIDGSGSSSIDAPATTDAPTGPMFAMTSPSFVEGGMIADANTCEASNTSPQLAWSGNAMGALAYAVVLTDKSNNLVHWVIYDIPAAATGLPATVENVYAPTNVAGAHQTSSYQTSVRGYLGPCPPVNGGPHTYEFAVYGVDAATLPGTSMATTRAEAITAITQHMKVKATLTGTYER